MQVRLRGLPSTRVDGRDIQTFRGRSRSRSTRLRALLPSRAANAVLLQHGESDHGVHLGIVWDDNNELHATQRATVTEITQAILDAESYTKGRTDATDRAMLVGTTQGGRRLRVVVQLRDSVTVRPITAREARRPT